MSEPTIRPPAPHGASPDGPVGGAEAPFAFERGLDSQNVALDVVRKYPVPCLLGAAALGFWIGRHRGKAIAAAAAGPGDERGDEAALPGVRVDGLLTGGAPAARTRDRPGPRARRNFTIAPARKRAILEPRRPDRPRRRARAGPAERGEP